MRLSDDERAVGGARRYARGWSATNGIDARHTDQLELLVSELVTNAVRHGSPPYQVFLGRTGHSLYGEVSDSSPSQPRVLPEPDHRGGFGLRIIDALASDWGISSAATGKAVWFELEANS